jgi:DNA repair photolyase
MTIIIYETKGRAREYCELAANLYRGCGHGCTYCYAPLAIRTSRDDFRQPRIRADVMYKFEKDAIELRDKGEGRSILLSFTTDPISPLTWRNNLHERQSKFCIRRILKYLY